MSIILMVAISVLGFGYRAYFNLHNPSLLKIGASVGLSTVLFAIFWTALARIAEKSRADDGIFGDGPASGKRAPGLTEF